MNLWSKGISVESFPFLTLHHSGFACLILGVVVTVLFVKGLAIFVIQCPSFQNEKSSQSF